MLTRGHTHCFLWDCDTSTRESCSRVDGSCQPFPFASLLATQHVLLFQQLECALEPKTLSNKSIIGVPGWALFPWFDFGCQALQLTLHLIFSQVHCDLMFSPTLY